MSLADGDRQEQVIHKEVIFDMNSNSEMSGMKIPHRVKN